MSRADLQSLRAYLDNLKAKYIQPLEDELERIESIAKGAQGARSFDNYSSMISELNSADMSSMNIGANILIVTLNVPDLWVSGVLENAAPYIYVSDEYFVQELSDDGKIQVGHFVLSPLETLKVNLLDYVKFTDYAQYGKVGLVRPNASLGIAIGDAGDIRIQPAYRADILAKTNGYKPICADNNDYAVKVGITTNTETLTSDEQLNAQKWLGVDDRFAVINTVLEQSGLVSKYKATIEDTYTERVTADGANVLDGSKAKLEKVVGSTVACKNLVDIPFINGATGSTEIAVNFDHNIFITAGEIATVSTSIWRISCTYADGTIYYAMDTHLSGNGRLVPATSDNPIVKIVYRGEYIAAGQYSKIMIAYGDTATEYQPYFTGLKSASFAGIESTNADGTETATLDFPKTEMPLGVTIDFENKKITDYGVEIVLNGTEKWTSRGNIFENVNQFYALLLGDTKYNFGEGVCTDFDKLSALINKVGFAIGSANAALYLSVDKTQFTSVEDLKAWLAQRYADGNPVKIRYVSSVLQNETDFTSNNEYTAYKGGTEKVLENDGKDYGADNTLSQNYIIVTEVK